MMMNTVQAKKMDMVELENVNGGGFFDFISDVVDEAVDFVTDTFESMEAPATSATEFIGEGIIDKLTEKMEECFPK